MEINGKEYSEDFIEKLKGLYLTVNYFNKYDLKGELGIHLTEANRVLDVVIPKPELKTIEDVWDMYADYKELVELRRVLRVKHPVTYILKSVVSDEYIREMYTDRNMLVIDILKELNLPPVVTESGLLSYIHDKKIYRKPENKDANRLKALGEFFNDPERVREAQEKKGNTNLLRFGFENPFQNEDIKEKIKETNLRVRGFEYATQSEEVKAKAVSTSMRKWGVPYYLQTEDKQIKSKETSLERYGFEYPSQSEEVKAKTVNTNMRNFGVPYYFQTEDKQIKSKKTSLERYGFEYPSQSEEVKAKVVSTNMSNIGVSSNLKLESVKEQIKKTNLKVRGFEYASQSEEVKAKSRKTNYLRYGAESWFQAGIVFTETEYVHSVQESIQIVETEETLKEFLYTTFPNKKQFTMHEIALIVGRKYNFIATKFNASLDFITSSKQGHLPEQIQNFLESLGFVKGEDFVTNNRLVIKPQEIDFYFPKQKVGIEVNDLVTHNSTYNKFGNELKPKNYHMDKSKLAKEKGIRLIHAWEHYMDNPQQYEVLKNAIKHALGISANRVYARNTYVKEVPNTSLKDFFNTNNIQGFRGAKTAYALFDKKTDEVLMAYSVGNPHFAHQKYDLELIRGASKLDTTIVGGASKLWKYIIDNNPEVNSIVYYIDRNIYNGSSISTLEGNIELINTQAGFWNYFVESGEMKNRQPKKHKEIKELVKQGKVWEVYNAGTETYVWTR